MSRVTEDRSSSSAVVGTDGGPLLAGGADS